MQSFVFRFRRLQSCDGAVQGELGALEVDVFGRWRPLVESFDAVLGAGVGLLGAIDVDVDRLLGRAREDGKFRL